MLIEHIHLTICYIKRKENGVEKAGRLISKVITTKSLSLAVPRIARVMDTFTLPRVPARESVFFI